MKFTIFLMVVFLATQSKAQDAREYFSTSQLLNEVISVAKHPHAYDYRNNNLELSVGTIDIMERNNFENSAYQFGINVPLGSGGFLRTRIRRTFLAETASTKELARTPFKQLALQPRYEFGGDFSFALMEGRSFTMLSPSVSDFEHIFLVFGGLQYLHSTQGNIPQSSSNSPAPRPGQIVYEPQWVIPLGLLWKLYFSGGMGVSLEYGYQLPLVGSREEMPFWTHFGFNIFVGI